MNIYRVRVLCRKRGAIGAFDWQLGTFEAWNRQEAHDKAFNWFQEQGWEVNAVEVIGDRP